MIQVDNRFFIESYQTINQSFQETNRNWYNWQKKEQLKKRYVNKPNRFIPYLRSINTTITMIKLDNQNIIQQYQTSIVNVPVINTLTHTHAQISRIQSFIHFPIEFRYYFLLPYVCFIYTVALFARQKKNFPVKTNYPDFCQMSIIDSRLSIREFHSISIFFSWLVIKCACLEWIIIKHTHTYTISIETRMPLMMMMMMRWCIHSNGRIAFSSLRRHH